MRPADERVAGIRQVDLDTDPLVDRWYENEGESGSGGDPEQQPAATVGDGETDSDTGKGEVAASREAEHGGRHSDDQERAAREAGRAMLREQKEAACHRDQRHEEQGDGVRV